MTSSSFDNDSSIPVSDRLRKSIPQILSDWEKRLRYEVLSAENQKSVALIKHIPGFLERLADELSTVGNLSATTVSNSRQIGKEEAEEQGSERANIGQYVLHEVILEYHILREVIFNTLEAQQPLRSRERDIILACIERSVNDTASQFVKSVQSFQEIFVLGLVHDLRGPANTATMAAQLILQDIDSGPESIKMLASIIHQSAVRIDCLTTDLLDASKVQAGGEISLLHFSDFDLLELLKKVIEEIQVSQVKIRTESSKVPVRWSPSAIQRIFENLVGNALKFGNPGCPVEVLVKESHDEITLAVHNEGAPIPIENRSKLFDKFSRGSDQIDKHGWGIGLVLVKGLIDAHHGTIEVESEESDGTTFIVRLPRRVV